MYCIYVPIPWGEYKLHVYNHVLKKIKKIFLDKVTLCGQDIKWQKFYKPELLAILYSSQVSRVKKCNWKVTTLPDWRNGIIFQTLDKYWKGVKRWWDGCGWWGEMGGKTIKICCIHIPALWMNVTTYCNIVINLLKNWFT